MGEPIKLSSFLGGQGEKLCLLFSTKEKTVVLSFFVFRLHCTY